MSKFSIILGKDPEELPSIWPDEYVDTKNFDDAFVAGKFETDNEDLFWRVFLTFRLHPCAMWYWIRINERQIISGAIDPDDIELLSESIDIPEWVKKEASVMDKCWSYDKYAKAYNKDL